MQPLNLLAGTLAYTFVVFPLAYSWHLVFFKDTYDQLGYFSRDEPVILFGFLSVLLQGFILSAVYPMLCKDRSVIGGATLLAAIMGTFLWTTHVLTAAAKHPIEPLSTWFALESAFLAVQFAISGLAIAFIYRSGSKGMYAKFAGWSK